MADRENPAPDLVATGVPGLDEVLSGGLIRRSMTIVIGAPGTGKTMLAQQVVFHNASRGASALYLTGYSETHDKLQSYSRSLSFFAPELIGSRIQFGSLPDLMRQGAEETEQAILATARAQGASLVVLDGFRSIRGFLEDDQAAAHFMYSVGAQLAVLGITTLILIEGDPDEVRRYPELTVCDVIITLAMERRGGRQRRLLQVTKARGAAHLEGVHPFVLNREGLSVFPRFESSFLPTQPAWHPQRAGFGIEKVDALLAGGLTTGTSTLVAGSPGVGKTLLGLHFLSEGLRAGEPVLFLGFMESVSQLREKARVFGLDLAASEASGQLRLLVSPAYDLESDQVMGLLREDVERRGVRRLVIDSAKELERGLGYPERVPDFLAALVSFLRGQEVTSYLTRDISTIMGPELHFEDTPLSVIAENLLVLRKVEYRGRLHKVLSVLKMRFSSHDQTIYEYQITEGRGIELIGPAPMAEGMLTGTAHWAAAKPEAHQSGEQQGAAWPTS